MKHLIHCLIILLGLLVSGCNVLASCAEDELHPTRYKCLEGVLYRHVDFSIIRLVDQEGKLVKCKKLDNLCISKEVK